MKSIVLGSSPNAFGAALALREAGQQVLMLEFCPDFGTPYAGPGVLPFVSLAAELSQGISQVAQSGRSALRPDGSFVRLTRSGLAGTFAAQDGARWPDFVNLIDLACGILRQLLENPAAPADLGEQWRALGRRTSMEVLRLPWMSLRDLLDEWFVDESLKGLLAEVALEGVCQGPFASGTVFHLLRRWVRGEVLEPSRVLGSLVGALRARAESRGIEILHTPGQVPTLHWQDGVPAALRVGEKNLPFDLLLSDKDVRWTFTQLVSPRHLETEFNSAVHKVRGRGVWAKGQGLAAWPGDWSTEMQKDVIHLHPGLRDLERAYDRLKRHQNLEKAPVQVCWPHFVDPACSPQAVEVVQGYASGNLSLQLADLHLAGPEYFENQASCSGGQLYGGDGDLSQSFFLRPFPGYESELPNLDLCGASLHPGDFSGRAGIWAAQRKLGALQSR